MAKNGKWRKTEFHMYEYGLYCTINEGKWKFTDDDDDDVWCCIIIGWHINESDIQWAKDFSNGCI